MCEQLCKSCDGDSREKYHVYWDAVVREPLHCKREKRYLFFKSVFTGVSLSLEAQYLAALSLEKNSSIKGGLEIPT